MTLVADRIMPILRGTTEANASLADFIWFRTGGAAETLVRPADLDDLRAYLAALPAAVPVMPIGVGSNLIVQVKQNAVMRVLPLENESVNECWLSDRDRFSYEGLNSVERLEKPMLRQDGRWREVDWPTALQYAAHALGTVGAVLMTYRRLFSADHRFLAARLEERAH